MDRSGRKWNEVGDFMLMGEYHHTIDNKGRLILPAKIRYELGEDFILTRGLDHCLFIYPRKEWDLIIEKYRQLPNTKEARNFMRFFLSGANVCELDKQGRINLQLPLMNYAKIEKECIIIGVNDHLEIWAKEEWENFVLENEDSISEIADHLFSTTI